MTLTDINSFHELDGTAQFYFLLLHQFHHFIKLHSRDNLGLQN